jgi:hypothetical protein
MPLFWTCLRRFVRNQFTLLLCFAVRPVQTAVGAELFHFETSGGRLLVLGAGVIPVFTFRALEGNDFSWHFFYSRALAVRSN